MFGDQAERCEHVGISGGWADSEAALRIVREQQLQYHALVSDVSRKRNEYTNAVTQ